MERMRLNSIHFSKVFDSYLIKILTTIGFNWNVSRDEDGPLAPHFLKELCGEDNEPQKNLIEKMNEGNNFPFNQVTVRTGRQKFSCVELGGLQLRRLDMLDKLNQEACNQLQK